VGTNARRRLAIGILLALLGAGLSFLLLLHHHGEGDVVDQLCGEGQTSGCATVAASAWSQIAGVPLAAAGVFFYLAVAAGLTVAAVAADDARDAIAFVCLALTGAALVADVFLLAIQAFSIHAFCRLCLATYGLNAAIAAALWPARRRAAVAKAAAARPDGRLAFVGWAVATLAVLAASGGAEAALRARASERSARLLGAPASGASAASTPAASAAGTSDAQRWQAEAQRLQQTLDDPQKLDQYFADKAAREFQQASVQTIELKGVPTKGPSSAPVQVVEFSDFLCPFCRNLAGGLTNFLPQSGDRIAVYYKNYPLEQTCNPKLRATTHPGACVLAFGGLCAQEQGRFWPYHDKVFGSQLQNPQPADAVRLAREAGLDGKALEECLTAQRTKDKLQSQIEEAQRLGVQATPTLFINGKKLPRINDFVQVVDKEAQAKGFAPLQSGPSH
jgi:protein-disulfide isomerase/uncharacterized membrane protein